MIFGLCRNQTQGNGSNCIISSSVDTEGTFYIVGLKTAYSVTQNLFQKLQPHFQNWVQNLHMQKHVLAKINRNSAYSSIGFVQNNSICPWPFAYKIGTNSLCGCKYKSQLFILWPKRLFPLIIKQQKNYEAHAAQRAFLNHVSELRQAKLFGLM